MIRIKIIARKHDQSFHRSWEQNTILFENDQEIIGVNNKTLVTNSDLSSFITKERGLFYFSKERWFNIIHIDDANPYYYCNLGSPFKMEGNTLTYIDYDIDLKVDMNFNYEILDLEEYNVNRSRFNYSDQLDKRLKENMNDLIAIIKNRDLIFSQETLKTYYKKYEFKNRRKFD